jgi:hypothetical protein
VAKLTGHLQEIANFVDAALQYAMRRIAAEIRAVS